MNLSDQYRVRAAHFRAIALQSRSLPLQHEFEILARSYVHLAEQVDRNSRTDLFNDSRPGINPATAALEEPHTR